jgi:hypothetical protein
MNEELLGCNWIDKGNMSSPLARAQVHVQNKTATNHLCNIGQSGEWWQTPKNNRAVLMVVLVVVLFLMVFCILFLIVYLLGLQVIANGGWCRGDAAAIGSLSVEVGKRLAVVILVIAIGLGYEGGCVRRPSWGFG